MNYAFFIRNFKGLPGVTYLINGDLSSLSWLSNKIRHAVAQTANSLISIGDRNPFVGSCIVNIVMSSEAEPYFRLIDQDTYELLINQVSLIELAGKIDGMVEFEKPSHNYLDICSGGVSRVLVTTGEYPASVLLRMINDEDRSGIGEGKIKGAAPDGA